ncbi:glucuronate isomerase [Fictibacillus enclensis]|uniref:glucuronate isomerase n=1 Tax=Fictibacillus enclensis TaxID=1017270 RepID=UPI0025A21037|nr:glucuronate isomerase [Fictibacillus enclensis]MDM5339065.1 glucuronate isomerase [Fictibacillus enclensis]
MEPFIHEDFLLQNETSKILYHQYAKELPIIDYHCHLSPREIAENKKFRNMTEIWLEGDHYKWRVMRALGVEEKYITGDASDYEKFKAWAAILPYCIGNPLFHWTQLELKRFFGTDILLSEKSCDEVWELGNEMLKQEDFSARSLIKCSNVEMIGTTDDPLDSLEYHRQIASDANYGTKVLPSFRPDGLLEINQDNFLPYVKKLEKVTDQSIEDYRQYLNAIKLRVEYFNEHGCRVSDHGFGAFFFEECTVEEASTIFQKKRDGSAISKLEENKFKTNLLTYLGQLYHSFGWVMQFHIGALRNTNERMYQQTGANSGFDSINDYELARPLNQFLNGLDRDNLLPRTILYSLNPVHNYIVSTTAGNFQSSGSKGKVQFGSGWWFNDQKDGMISQMRDLANTGVLSTFVGMLTDSRSFLSYTRHEYFRRILCNLLGNWVEKGEYPADFETLSKITQGISYYNAKEFFTY